MNKTDTIPAACNRCREKRCEGLYWKAFLVFTDQFAVPFDCPLRVKDESDFLRELQSLSEYDVSRIAGEVWVRHNYGLRYGNGKHDEIEHILMHFRQSKCAMIAKSQNSWYKPWTRFGFWAGTRAVPMLSKKTKDEESALTDVLADEAPALKGPLTISNLRWEHTDEQRKQDSATVAASGDTIRLLADIENYVEGAGVDFYIWDNAIKPRKQLVKLHTRCKNKAGLVEWTVDLSKASVEPEIKFECEARSKLSAACEVKVEKPAGFSCRFRLAIDPDDPETQDDIITLFSTDDGKSYRQEKTVKDDVRPGDDYLDLEFTEVSQDLRYSLEVAPGKEGAPYLMFENANLDDME